MIDYRSLYEAFVEAEAEAERQALGEEPGAWDRAWQLEHRPSWLEFQALLWEARHAASIQDVVTTMGTVCGALALVAVLRRHAGLELADDGTLRWQAPLFPTPPAPVVDAATAPEWMTTLAADAGFGQLRTSLQSSERRAVALLRSLPPFGRRVLLLGDDDLTSIFIAARRPGEVVVADVDPRVLEAVDRARQTWDLPLRSIELDVRRPLPSELRGGFDVVHLDPMDDGVWLELWTQRAMEACREQAGARIGISVAPRRLGRRLMGLHAFLQHGGFALHSRDAGLGRYPLRDVDDAFYRAHEAAARALGLPPSPSDRVWEIPTDLLCFVRRAAPWPMLWPQTWREIRRAV
ncbi:MAG: bis-aminopropyl spermidine synthase family protein [Myxococcales bacterium]|nr:bis-aminopropyl spermidine synthase family protein [Myxococcales bacterium]